MAKLAINGGKPLREKLFPRYNTITEEEVNAAIEVLETGKLSGFLANYSKEFYGGRRVQEFEVLWAEKHNAKYCISVNSATSGLVAAVGAAGIGPGDEVIVSPYTMSASASCVFAYGAVPVFSDIQGDIFNLDPKSIESRITPFTKAIVVVHLFGNPADMDPIMKIARKHNLIVIEDCAQAPLAEYKGGKVGTIGDMGVFSLNIHKHIQTGEGGMITTNSEEFATKLKLIRNHGELSLNDLSVKEYTNMWGFNFRLTEIQAAIGITQLKRLEKLVDERIDNCDYLAEKMSEIPGIIPPRVHEHCKNVYYMQAFKFKEETIGVPRDKFIQAVAEELPLTEGTGEDGKFLYSGYVEPIYLQPLYQKASQYRSPITDPRYKGKVNYAKGICPVCETLHFKELFNHEYMRPPMTKGDLDDFVSAFEKVYENREELL